MIGWIIIFTLILGDGATAENNSVQDEVNDITVFGNNIILLLNENINRTNNSIISTFQSKLNSLTNEIDFTKNYDEAKAIGLNIFVLSGEYIYVVQQIYMALKRFSKDMNFLRARVCQEDSIRRTSLFREIELYRASTTKDTSTMNTSLSSEIELYPTSQEESENITILTRRLERSLTTTQAGCYVFHDRNEYVFPFASAITLNNSSHEILTLPLRCYNFRN